ncbi:MAG TPA: uracil-DNA glycosylase [Anaerolineae bacterium]|jgi:DNA polymerase|nr:uracil-DNA glycosylase [Anaerolineae bacterium]
MAKIDKSQVLREINEDIAGCDRCRALPGVGDIPVFPRGNTDALAMLVGEGPGEQEERQQKPFVGSAGRLLEETLKGFGFNVERDFYITNVVKYRSFTLRPPGRKVNKPPTVKQMNTEREFLEREIAMVKPKLIVALGAKASQWFLGKDFKLTQERGEFYNWHGITILPTYHPAAILRARAIGDGEERIRDFKQDLQKIKEIIKPSIAA